MLCKETEYFLLDGYTTFLLNLNFFLYMKPNITKKRVYF